MKRQTVLDILAANGDKLREKGVASLSLFGSVARDDAAAGSDVDLLVEFARPIGLFAFIRLRRYLEDVLSCRVDLVTPDALRPSMRERIMKEAVRAA